MNNSAKAPLGILIASIAAALLSIAARCALTLTSLDAEYGVYEHGAVLPVVYHALLFLALAGLAAAGVMTAPRRIPDYRIPITDFTIFTACACGFMIAAESLLSLYYIISGSVSPELFDLLELAFSIPTIIYFFSLIKSDGRRTPIMVFMSFFIIAWCATCLIRSYFDSTQLMTSPNKTIGELALLCAMIYFLSESRIQLGAISHRFFMGAAAAAPVMLLTSAIPNLFLSDYLSIGRSDSFMRYAVEAAFALFIYMRLAAYITMPEADEPLIRLPESNDQNEDDDEDDTPEEV